LGKFRTFSGKEICRLSEQHGFIKVRQKGSHIVMQKRTEETTITVPVPDHKEIRTGTLLSIIRQSQLERSLFET
jgi:predicted RNA binding protein YcfA (HicA-like mRNA interferase family)